MRFPGLQIIAMAVLAANLAAAAEAPWVQLHGTVDDGTVKLYWETHDWPQDLQGFNLKRRATVGPGAMTWEPLNQRPLVPALGQLELLADQGLTAEQIRHLDSRLEELTAAGRLPIMAPELVLRTLKQNRGLKSGDRLRMKTDFDLALLSRFAYIDNVYAEAAKPQYGLFYVQDSGRELPEPLALYSPTGAPLSFASLSAQPAERGVLVSWLYSNESQQAHALVGCRLMRAVDNGEPRLLEVDLLGGRPTVDGEQWTYLDGPADNSLRQVYTVIGIDMFQQEALRQELIFAPADFAVTEAVPIATAELAGGRDIRLTWQLATTLEARLRGFVIERASSDDQVYQAVSPLLPPTARDFVDSGPKTAGSLLLYRLVTVDLRNQTLPSAEKQLFYLGLDKPPAVGEGTAMFATRQGKHFVQLRWRAKAADDKLTAGYIIASDELQPGNLVEQGSLGVVQGDEYMYPLRTKGGREYQFQVWSVGADGARGEPLTMTCYVPLLEMPRVELLEAYLTRDQRLQITWEYPLLPDQRGFRIYANGKQMVAPPLVSPAVRGWVFPEPMPGEDRLCRLQIQAIGTHAEAQISQERAVLVPPNLARGLPAPEELQAKLIERDGNRYAELSWRQLNLEVADIEGYILYCDYAAPGIVSRLASLPLIKGNTFSYKLEDEPRDQYTFRVAPMGTDRKIGPHTDVTLTVSRPLEDN